MPLYIWAEDNGEYECRYLHIVSAATTQEAKLAIKNYAQRYYASVRTPAEIEEYVWRVLSQPLTTLQDGEVHVE